MASERAVPEQHMRRLDLAVRAVELVPAVPEAAHGPLRAGLAGEVPLCLCLRQDGALEVRAEAPLPLPEGLELHWDERKHPHLHARNPAAARRLWSRPEVRKRLETLFELAPQAWVSTGAVQVVLAPETSDERIQATLRAALRATTALTQASQELEREAEQNRASARRELPPEALEGGRRFIQLLPGGREEAPLLARDEALVSEAVHRFEQGEPERVVQAYLARTVTDQEHAWRLLLRARRAHDDRHRTKGLVHLLLSPVLMGACLFLLVRLTSLQSSILTAACLGIPFVLCLGIYLGAKGIERIVHGGAKEREENNLVEAVFSQRDEQD